MPFMCFSYPADVPLSGTNRDAAQRPCPARARCRFTCFSYPADVPLGPRNREAAQPPLPGLRRMPAGTCFRY